MPTDPTTVLFAAGRGERLRPLTDTVPKPCLPLLDIPLGAWGLGALVALGGEVIVNVSYRAPQVVAALEPHAGGARFVVESPHPYGTAGTLAALRRGMGPRVLTWNADVLTDLDPSELLGAHERHGAPATLAVAEVGAGADLVLTGDSASGFVDRRARPGAAGARFIGVAVFEDDVLARLPDTRPLGVAEALLRPLTERREIAVHRHGGYALDIGTPERYLRASLDLLDGRGPRPARRTGAPARGPLSRFDLGGGRPTLLRRPGRESGPGDPRPRGDRARRGPRPPGRPRLPGRRLDWRGGAFGNPCRRDRMGGRRAPYRLRHQRIERSASSVITGGYTNTTSRASAATPITARSR